MTAILCLDDNNGMMFNHRRQSQDKQLRKQIISHLKGNPLWMNAYSANQFSDFTEFITGSRDDLIAQGYAPCKRCNP